MKAASRVRFGKLFAHPGFLTRATLEGERDAYLSALKLFLVANLVVFLVGPYVGAVAFGLDGYLDERVASSAFFRPFVERELLALGMSAEAYELRFDFTIEQHAPTFFFLMIPAIACLTKVLLPGRLFGEHLVVRNGFRCVGPSPDPLRQHLHARDGGAARFAPG